MQSFRDKLLQAGLITEDYRPGESTEQRSARLNKASAEKRAKVAEIVAATHVETSIGEETFFFITRSKKMRRLVIEAPIKAQLEKGELAVADWPDRPDFPWAVIPRAAAERLIKVDRDALRFYIRSDQEQFGVAK